MRYQLALDRFGGGYVWGPGFLFWVYFRRNFEAVAEFAHGLVLDVGCGNQPYRAMLNNGARYVGLDYPAVRSVHLRDRDDVRPHVWADALRLPVRANAIDTVVCTQVLEHLTDPFAFFSEASRVLRPGGALIVTTHGLYAIHGSPYDYFRFTEFGLKHLAEQEGLIVARLLRNGSFWAFWGLMLNLYVCGRLFEQWESYALRVVFGTLKVVATPLLLVFATLVNLVCYVADMVCTDTTVTSNYALVAIKTRPAAAGAAGHSAPASAE